MSYRCKTYKKKFQKNGKTEEKYFAVAKSTCLLSIEELAQEIGQRSINEKHNNSSSNRTFNVMGDKLTHGYNIKLEKIGTFGVAVKSKGYDTPSRNNPKTSKIQQINLSSR